MNIRLRSYIVCECQTINVLCLNYFEKKIPNVITKALKVHRNIQTLKLQTTSNVTKPRNSAFDVSSVVTNRRERRPSENFRKSSPSRLLIWCFAALTSRYKTSKCQFFFWLFWKAYQIFFCCCFKRCHCWGMVFINFLVENCLKIYDFKFWIVLAWMFLFKFDEIHK